MVLGKLPVPGRPTIWITVGQGPTALTVGAGGGCLDIFTLIYPFSPLSPSLWETARYRLKYCLKGPSNPKQPTNQNLCLNAISLKYYKSCLDPIILLKTGLKCAESNDRISFNSAQLFFALGFSGRSYEKQIVVQKSKTFLMLLDNTLL